MPPPEPRRRRNRGLTALAASAAVGAAGLVALAVVDADGTDDAGVVVTVDDAMSAAPPTTVPPLDPGTGTDDRIDDRPVSTAPTPPTTSGVPDSDERLSPLAELLDPPFSAIPDEIEPRPRPVGIVSDRIDIDRFPVRAVGLKPDGQMEIPDETEIGWYQYGATAGRPGATVLAAHVSWNRTTGPFFRLGTKEPGDVVTVTLDDGTTREYEVTERTMYDKDELPRERIWRNTGPETLVLITCGGDFNPEIRRYRQNIVVYAVPVG